MHRYLLDRADFGATSNWKVEDSRGRKTFAKNLPLISNFDSRLERQKLEEKSDWHASSDSKDCVKVDRLGNGLGRLWRQQICQFNNVTLDISEAIAQVYKTPTSLIKVTF